MKCLAVLSCVAALSTFACAPEHASKVRQDKSLTLGLPGVSYRPNGKIGVGVTAGAASNQKQTVDNSKTGLSSVIGSSNDANSDEADQRQVVSSFVQISPFVQYFPWDTSAFFVGVGGTYYRGSYKFNEEKVDSTSLNPQFAEVDYQTRSNYIGVPLGWAWIWESGFSLTLDFGPRARVSRSAELTKDGKDEGVSSSERDKTVSTIDSLEPKYTYGGSGIIGWSF